jgi:phosphohistidine phosphatase
MKTVTLFRHAKSGEKGNPRIRDFDRPLSNRGLKAAPKMGAAMRERHLRPTLILCSPSVRTRQTLTLASTEAWDNPPKVRFDKRLYEASAQTILDVLKEVPEDADHVMIVGHNPGMQDFAVMLSVSSKERQRLKDKLPTASVVTLEFDEELWKDLQPATGHVVLYMSPKTLPPAGRGQNSDYDHR